MSKYEPLVQFLSRQTTDNITVDFAKIESELGSSLPPSAYRYNAWWANQTGKGHTQTTCWQVAGWKTKDVDLSARKVSFERTGKPSEHKDIDDKFGIEERVWQTAHLITGINDRGDLVRQALRQFMAQHAAQELIAMGGTMPDAQIPERRRPFA